MKELEINPNLIDEILEEGVQCCAEAEIGEVVSCLMTMFENIQHSQLVQNFKNRLDQKNHEDLDNFIICLFMSEIATLTANFKNREEEGAEA